MDNLSIFLDYLGMRMLFSPFFKWLQLSLIMFMWHRNVQQGIEWKFLQLNFRCTVIVYALEHGNIFTLSSFSQSLLAFFESAHEINFLFIV